KQGKTATIEQETLREKARTYFKKQLAALIKLPFQQIEDLVPLSDYGFDSILAIRITRILEDIFGPLGKTLLFEYPTIHSMTEYFLHSYPEQLKRVLRVEEVDRASHTTTDMAQATHGGNGPKLSSLQQTMPFRLGSHSHHHQEIGSPSAPIVDGSPQHNKAV